MTVFDYKPVSCPIHGGQMIVVEVDERIDTLTLHHFFKQQIAVEYRGTLCQCQFKAQGAKHEFIPEASVTLAGSTCSQ